MIKTFKHKGLEQFFYTGTKKGIRPEHAGKLERILDRLNAANELGGSYGFTQKTTNPSRSNFK